MATETKYPFSILADFPNQKVDPSRLTREILESAIVIALSHINTSGDTCDVWFKDPLSGGDETLLDALIAAHSGEPFPVQGALADGTPLVAIAQRQADGVPLVAVAPTTGSEIVIASHNLCDKCSWFGDSGRVTSELLVDDGDGTTFNSAHAFWIDMISGRVHDDERWIADQKVRQPSTPHGYQVIVTVDDVEQTMREPFEASGGDYEIIWETGQVHFFVPPSEAPRASYSYAQGSTFYVRPSAGKTLRILKAEADVAIGAKMTDAILYSLYGLVDALAPELMPGVPSGTMIPLGEVSYKRMGQIAAEAQGAFPPIEVLGASDAELAMPIEEFRRKSRGTRSKVQALPFNYSTTRDLYSAAMMEIRIHTKHDRAFDGDTVTVTFYCVSQNQS